ncbi:polyprotein [Rosavirus B]|uniref:Genome polyprotein n=1 Tax=rosavirus B1 TaxID=2871195 RepID=A0A1C9LUU7_9PICO|nr:polyprotein [Rosavirus B]AOQ26202.1 polyprotein [Rosavirus B]
MAGRNGSKTSAKHSVSGLPVTNAIASVLEPIPVVGQIAGAVQGLASSWLSSLTDGLLNSSAFEIGQSTATSDRLLEVSVGSTSMSSQDAVTVRDGWPGDGQIPRPLPPPVDKPTPLGPAGERLRTLAVADWNARLGFNNPLLYAYLPNDLTKDSSTDPSNLFHPTADRHALMRSDILVVVTVNANPFTSGLLLVVAVPNCPPTRWDQLVINPQSNEHNWIPAYFSRQQLTLFPHQFINLKTNNQATLVLPYVGMAPVMAHHHRYMYRLFVFEWSQLYRTPYTSNTPVTVTLQAAVTNAEFYGLNTHRQLVTLFQNDTRLSQNQNAIVSTHPLTDCVVLAQGAQALMDTSYLPGRVTSFSQPLSVPTLMAITQEGWGGILVTPNYTKGTFLYGFPVDLKNVVFMKTYIGEMANLFSQWTGTINFHLMAVTTAMTRGRIAVCFSPGDTTEPKTMEQAMAGTVAFFDIGLNSTFTFPIPFISETVWRTLAEQATQRNQQFSYYPPTSRMGVVTVWLYNQIQSTAPGDTAPVVLLPFASAGSDFSFRLPTQNALGVPPYAPQQNWYGAVRYNYQLSGRPPTPPPGPDTVRFENGEKEGVVIHMGDSDAAQADAQPTQADVASQPACYGNLEPGQPVQVTPADAWEGVTGFVSHSSPDMLLENFLGRRRLYATIGIPDNTSDVNSWYAPIPIQIAWQRGEDFPTSARNIQHMFAFWQVDVRVDLQFQFHSEPNWQTIATIANIPPGADPYLDLAYMDQIAVQSRIYDFPFVTAPLSRSNNTISVVIPWQSPYNALAPWLGGWSNVANVYDDTAENQIQQSKGAGWGVVPFRELCYLGVLLSPSHSCTVNVFVSYHNVQCFIPQPFPQYGLWTAFPDGTQGVNRVSTGEVVLHSLQQPFSLNNGKYKVVNGQTQYLFPVPVDKFVPLSVETRTRPSARDLSTEVVDELTRFCIRDDPDDERPARFESGELEWDDRYDSFDDYPHDWSWAAQPPRPYVAKRNWAGTSLTHWMIVCGEKECSLEQDGFDAVVRVKPLQAPCEFVESVPQCVWSQCLFLSKINYKFPNYHVLHNCTDFVENLTGVKCENSGKRVLASLALVGALSCAAAVAVSFEAPPREKTRSPRVYHKMQRCPALAEQPRITEDTVDGKLAVRLAAFGVEGEVKSEWEPRNWIPRRRRTMSGETCSWLPVREEGGPLKSLEQAGDQLASTLKKLDSALTPENVEILVNSAKTIGCASSSVDNLAAQVSRMLDKLPTVVSQTQKFVAKKCASVLLKLVGLLLVIFSSPNPLTIAGVLAMLLGEAVDAASPDWAGSIKRWFCKKLKIPLSVMDYAPPCPTLPLLDESQANVQQESPKAQSTGEKIVDMAKDFNVMTLSARNVEWILDKLKEFVEWLLATFTNWKKDAPEAQFMGQRHKIFELFADSVHAMDGQNINIGNVQKNKELTQKLMDLCSKVRDVTCLQILQRTYSNYCAVERKARQAQYSDRAEPVVVYLYGEPGCGKSLLSTILAKGFCKALGLDPKYQIYSQIPNSDFMDGYTGQAIHIIDDLGQDPEGKDWQNFCQMVSTVKFLPNMADLEQKGIPYSSKIVIATSNFSDPTYCSARAPAALVRRIRFPVNVKVRHDTRLNARHALTPTGPCAHPCFRALCPLMDGAVSMILTRDAQKQISFFDLFDAVLTEVHNRAGVHDQISQICFENPIVREWEVEPDTFTLNLQDLEKANFRAIDPTCEPEPIRLPETVSELKLPWFTKLLNPDPNQTWVTVAKVAAVLSLVTSVLGVGFIIYKAVSSKESEEGAYSGLKKAAKKAPKPPALSPPKVQYEGLPQIYNPVSKNCFPIQFFDREPQMGCGWYTLTALGVFDRTYVCNAHGFRYNKYIQIRGRQYAIEDLKMRRVERNGHKTDVMIFSLPDGPCVKNILKFLRKSPDLAASRSPAVISVRSKYNLEVLATGIQDFGSLDMSGEQLFGVLRYRAVTAPGYCGAPLISYDPSHEQVLGIHMASNGAGIAYGSSIFQSDFAEAKAEGLREYAGPGLKVHVPTHSKLHPSPAYGAFPVDKEPAVLTQRDERLLNVKLDDVLFSKYKSDMKEPFPGLEIGREIVRNRLKALIPNPLPQITLQEAIDGIDGMDGIDMNQSPGVPYIAEGISRRSLFTLVDDHWVPCERLAKDVAACSVDPQLGHFATFLKDELRTKQKVQDGKTRVVEAGNLAHVLVGRKIFGNLFALFNSNPGFQTMCGVGGDPDTLWTELYHPLSQKRFVFDYDYSGFDGSVPTCAFDALADVLKDFVEGEEDVRKYIHSISQSFHHYKGKLWRLDGAMPSGCCGTSVFNSLINAMLLFSCFSQICPDFQSDEPLIIAYGDDVLVGTNQDLLPSKVAAWVNKNTTFCITPADKGDTFNDETDIHQCQFLKRHFTPDPDFPHLIHPTIEPATYEQSVMWQRTGDFQETINSLAQLVWHRGPYTYRKWCNAIAAKCDEGGHQIPYFPPFSLLRHNWLMKFEVMVPA